VSLQTWVGQLAAVVLLAGVADLLVPHGGVRGYARAILGLVVLVAVLRPVLGWAHAAVDWRWSAAPPPALSVAAEAARTRDVFRRLLAAEIDRIAASVPGVAGARASVDAGPGEPPAVVAVDVRVTASVADPRPAAALRQGVARAVSAALDLPPDKVTVEVSP
jgi:stage III sporulation protein AF